MSYQGTVHACIVQTIPAALTCSFSILETRESKLNSAATLEESPCAWGSLGAAKTKQVLEEDQRDDVCSFLKILSRRLVLFIRSQLMYYSSQALL